MIVRAIFNLIIGVLAINFVLVMILALPVIVLSHAILKQDLPA